MVSTPHWIIEMNFNFLSMGAMVARVNVKQVYIKSDNTCSLLAAILNNVIWSITVVRIYWHRKSYWTIHNVFSNMPADGRTPWCAGTSAATAITEFVSRAWRVDDSNNHWFVQKVRTSYWVNLKTCAIYWFRMALYMQLKYSIMLQIPKWQGIITHLWPHFNDV